MLRSSFTLAGVVLIGAVASAQTGISSKIKPITGPVRNAGTLHVASNTWSRKAQQINIGADTIYDNTCNSTYFSGLSTDTYVDEGRVPSPSGVNNLNNKPGCRTSYTVDGFQFAYCTDQATGSFTYTINFYATYASCTSALALTPDAGFVLGGLPGGVGGATNCWILNVDLDSPPLTASAAFTLAADGDGTYSNGTGDLFGWSMASTAAGTNTGPLIAGDLATCTGYDGTRWDPTINYLEEGTGMTTQNRFYVEGGATTAGCYFFNGLPMSSFWLELYADACVVPEPGTPFCIGDGVTPHTNCPCSNVSATADAVGCLNSLGTGGKLRGTGNASISADTVVLNGSQMPNSSVLYFQGTIQQNSGNGTAFGDGLRCAGGSILRLATTNNVGGVSTNPDATHTTPIHTKGNITVPGTRTYQAWYRNAAAFCTASTFNLTNGYQIVWGA